MKRLMIYLGLVLALVGCGGRKAADQYLHKPDWDAAPFRAEIGSVFYEDEDCLGLHLDSVGTFIYDLESQVFTTWIMVKGDTFEGYAPIPAMSKDENYLVFRFENPSDGSLHKTRLIYNIADKALFVLGDKEEILLVDQPWVELEEDLELYSSFDIKNLYHTLPSGDRVYPFK